MSNDRILGTRLLEDGRELTLYEMIFNVRLVIGDPDSGTYDDGWCFHKRRLAENALANWDGQGNPYGFYRHLKTDERQEQFA